MNAEDPSFNEKKVVRVPYSLVRRANYTSIGLCVAVFLLVMLFIENQRLNRTREILFVNQHGALVVVGRGNENSKAKATAFAEMIVDLLGNISRYNARDIYNSDEKDQKMKKSLLLRYASPRFLSKFEVMLEEEIRLILNENRRTSFSKYDDTRVLQKGEHHWVISVKGHKRLWRGAEMTGSGEVLYTVHLRDKIVTQWDVQSKYGNKWGLEVDDLEQEQIKDLPRE